MNKIQEIEQVIRPVLDQNNFELIDTLYLSEAGRMVLRVFIDKKEVEGQPQKAVTLDDCGKASNLIGDIMDGSDLIDSSYVLEVSSPGINRPLKTEAHFKKAVGQNVKVSLFAPLSPSSVQKNFAGPLLQFHGGSIEVEDATSGKVEIPLKSIAKAHLDLI